MKRITSGHYRVVVGALDDGTPFNIDFTDSLDNPIEVDDDVAARFEGDPHVFIYDVETEDGDNSKDDDGKNEPPNDGGSSVPDGDGVPGEDDQDQDEQNQVPDNAPEGDSGTTETKSDAQPAATDEKPKNKGGRPKGSTSSNGSGKRRTTLDG